MAQSTLSHYVEATFCLPEYSLLFPLYVVSFLCVFPFLNQIVVLFVFFTSIFPFTCSFLVFFPGFIYFTLSFFVPALSDYLFSFAFTIFQLTHFFLSCTCICMIFFFTFFSFFSFRSVNRLCAFCVLTSSFFSFRPALFSFSGLCFAFSLFRVSDVSEISLLASSPLFFFPLLILILHLFVLTLPQDSVFIVPLVYHYFVFIRGSIYFLLSFCRILFSSRFSFISECSSRHGFFRSSSFHSFFFFLLFLSLSQSSCLGECSSGFIMQQFQYFILFFIFVVLAFVLPHFISLQSFYFLFCFFLFLVSYHLSQISSGCFLFLCTISRRQIASESILVSGIFYLKTI